ncbi:hypothetical protein [Kineococcus sp. SYSU DK005]|uniref:hypothetical protein n=1 Tax=Kineococcus sp. SYSU DK005 TaxID=3383126 RepID=UPI003D7DD5A0
MEHLVVTTVVKDTEWSAGASAVLAAARDTLHARAQRRGLTVQGQPHEDVEVLRDAHRVRITLTAQATAAPST